VDFKSYVAATRVGSDQKVPFRGLTLVNSRKASTDNRQAWPVGPLFSAAQMRHNFAIWALERSGTSCGRLHLYYCLRCKWAFRVDDRSGSVPPLDLNGNPIQELEAAERLATFGVGPCPAFYPPNRECPGHTGGSKTSTPTSEARRTTSRSQTNVEEN
jgi:hypothetical protein